MTSTQPTDPPTAESIAALIDHAILKPEFTAADVQRELAIAAEWSVFSVCVRPSDIGTAVRTLQGTGIATGTVIGFPHGSTSTAAKVAESQQALAEGASELDMVLRIGALRSGETSLVEDDIAAVVAAADGRIVKVILETVFLTDAQIIAGCQAAERAGASFVKTSTGFAGGGATMHHLSLMRGSVSPAVRVKASGGVRGLDTVLEMLTVPVDRFGTSATAVILTDARELASAGAAPGRIDQTSY